MSKADVRRLALLLSVVVALAAPAFAQSQATTGVIEGVVSDESGAPVSGATVTLRNTATNFERVVATDADGRFRGLLLPLGPYWVSVSLTGFATGNAAKTHGLRSVDVKVKGPGSGRESAIRALQTVGIEVKSIRDVTPIPHNGCRPTKRRRV